MSSRERSYRDVREHLADVINAAIQGDITYITSNGRPVCAVVPLAIARNAEPADEQSPPVE